jgi:hypothetical protein
LKLELNIDSSESNNEKKLQKASNSSIKIPELTLEAKIFVFQEKITKIESIYTVLLNQQKELLESKFSGLQKLLKSLVMEIQCSEALIYTKESKLNFLQKMEQKTIGSSKKHLHLVCLVSSKSSEEKNKEYSRKLAQ